MRWNGAGVAMMVSWKVINPANELAGPLRPIKIMAACEVKDGWFWVLKWRLMMRGLMVREICWWMIKKHHLIFYFCPVRYLPILLLKENCTWQLNFLPTRATKHCWRNSKGSLSTILILSGLMRWLDLSGLRVISVTLAALSTLCGDIPGWANCLYTVETIELVAH